MPGERAWRKAVVEHEAAVAELLSQINQVPPERWHTPRAENKWSPAEEALHVAVSYEFGLAAITQGKTMRLRISPLRARLSRWFILPVLIRTGRFPRGVPAPREVRPLGEEAATLSLPAAAERLRRAATEAIQAAQAADASRPPVFVVHAYFGPLRLLTALRVLTAHTRHHARNLRR